MIDIEHIKNNKTKFKEQIQKRGFKIIELENYSSDANKNQICLEYILDTNNKRKSLIQQIDLLQQTKNQVSFKIESIYKNNNSDKKAQILILKEESKKTDQQITDKKADLKKISAQLQKEIEKVPNILDDRVPAGMDESENKVIKVVGKKKSFDFPPKEHHEIGKNLGMMHFDVATKVADTRTSFLSRDIAHLHRALINFMLDLHTKEGDFIEMNFPVLVNQHSMFCTGQLLKFGSSGDSFYIPSRSQEKDSESGLFLCPTGEVPMINSVSESLLPEKSLPLKFVGYSECFRREAGATGRDNHGIMRQKQFGKVELITICNQESAEKEQEKMLDSIEKILNTLDLHYRVCILCSGDTGFTSKLTYDVEVWMPGQNAYREISSCSNTGDFQSRRMNTRYKEGKIKKYPATLNGSGVAIGRMIVAIMENYQNTDGSITIPEKLRPYMGNMASIKEPKDAEHKLDDIFKKR